MNFIDQAVEQYCEAHTQPEPNLLQALKTETFDKMSLPQMLTGRLEGRFLKLLVRLSQAKTILEIGTFTGYSALSMAEALPEEGQLITCEIDEEARVMAQFYFDKSSHGHKIAIKMGPALETIANLEQTIDLVFIDADKANYLNYYEAVIPKLRSGGLIAIDNALWSGSVLKPEDESSQAIHELNSRIAQDDRVENVLLTVRDGLNLVVKL